ncbi:MAG: Uma2 family endonuclease [Bryobacteraceae bacterium]
MPNAAIALPPPLQEGDRLDSAEFLRRWEAMPDLRRAELLGGVVFMPSPVSSPHGRIHSVFSDWLGFYAVRTPVCQKCLDTTWVMGETEVPQPDIALRILPEHGGQSGVRGNYATGAPELIVEIVMSSHDRDLRTKLQTYEQAGVREYITALLPENKIVWRALSAGKFRTLPVSAGQIRSRIFPGLWLDVEAIWRCDTKTLLAVVERGTATPAHAEFAAAAKRPR